jgi:hypothetical protein
MLPVPPMRRAYVDPFPGLRIEPTAKRAPARKREGVNHTLGIDHGELEFALPWSADDRLPVHAGHYPTRQGGGRRRKIKKGLPRLVADQFGGVFGSQSRFRVGMLTCTASETMCSFAPDFLIRTFYANSAGAIFAKSEGS